MKRNGSWGGNIEIQAASLLYNVNVIIHQLDQPRWEIVNFEDAKTKTIHLSYPFQPLSVNDFDVTYIP